MSAKTALRMLLQSAIMSALLFVGWGMNDLGNFFSTPARAGLYLLVLVRSAAETMCLGTDPLVTERELGGLQCWIPAFSRLIMAFLCWSLPFADRWGILTFTETEGMRYLGLALFLGGGAVQLVAMHTLGRQYSVHVTIKNHHRLVQGGIYALIRHPIYLGLMLNILGVAMVFRSRLLPLLVVLLAAFVGSRIRQEERLLLEAFGAEFDSYRERTKRVLPHLY
jgi:protein-S-isoprenylcysteine O-methyltransferase Ste14